MKLLFSLQQGPSLVTPGSLPNSVSVSLPTSGPGAEQHLSLCPRRQGGGLGPGRSTLRSEKDAVEPGAQQFF